MDNAKARNNGPVMGTTLYAFTNEFLSRRFSFEELLSETAKRNIGPHVEIIGFQSFRGFPHISDEQADDVKALMARYQLQPSCLGINADQEIRRGKIASVEEMVNYHEPQIKVAAKLGFPVVRYQYGASPEVIKKLVPLAEKLGIKMGLEIHAPQHANHPDVMRYREMYEEVNSPALGWIPDFSSTMQTVPESFLQSLRVKGVPEAVISMALDYWHSDGVAEERMAKFKDRAEKAGFAPQEYGSLSMIFPMFGRADPASWNELMAQVIHVHGKFYGFNDDAEEAIDYANILPLFKKGGFKGVISSEWEGFIFSDANAFEMVQKHQKMCQNILGQ